MHPRHAEAHRDAWSHELGILVHWPAGSRLLAWALSAVRPAALLFNVELPEALPEACYLVALTRVSRVAVQVGRTPSSPGCFNGFHADWEVPQWDPELAVGNCRPTIDRGVGGLISSAYADGAGASQYVPTSTTETELGYAQRIVSCKRPGQRIPLASPESQQCSKPR